jgi:hypothetical protein
MARSTAEGVEVQVPERAAVVASIVRATATDLSGVIAGGA